MQRLADFNAAPPAAAVSPRADVRAAGVLERRMLRMAFDMHDGPMQELVAVGYGLRALRETALSSLGEPDAASVASGFDELFVQLAEVERRLRSMMFALDEAAAPPADLLLVVAEQVQAFRRRSVAVVEVVTEGDLELHTDSQRIAVERVLQESLSNVAKHAGASHVTVQLFGTGQSVLVRVRDDGRGFCPDEVGRSGIERVGLQAMRERLDLIGASLTVESRPGGPTTITAVIEKWQPGS